MAKLFDQKCLDLARHFYPDYPEPILTLLAEEIQTVCEDFSDGLKYDLEQILAEKRAERAAQETSVAPTASEPFCEDCPPIGYPTDATRCTACPRARVNRNA